MNIIKTFLTILLLAGILTGCGETTDTEAPLTENIEDGDTPVDDPSSDNNTTDPTPVVDLAYKAAISAGQKFSLTLDSVGNVFSFGDGNEGQLGHGDTDDRTIPERIATANKIVAISAGLQHSLLLDKYGDVYSFGSHSQGELGHGMEEDGLVVKDSDVPKKIDTLSNIIAIETGNHTSFAIDAKGDVYSFGQGHHDQLGHGDHSDYSTPKKIEALSNIVSVSSNGGAISDHTLALDKDGDVYSFGSGYYGQLGLGEISHQSTPKKIETLSKIVAIATGERFSLALDSSGYVYSFGIGYGGQLGHGDDQDSMIPKKIDSLSNIIAIAAGSSASFAIDNSGDVYAFGNDQYSQLGIGINYHYNYFFEPTKVDDLSHIVQIAVGVFHTLALDEDGYAYSFGYGSRGELGHDDQESYDTPKKIDALSL